MEQQQKLIIKIKEIEILNLKVKEQTLQNQITQLEIDILNLELKLLNS